MTYTIQGKNNTFEIVIGCEIHAQVASHSKLFSRASTGFGAAQNSHVSLVDAAMPGMLPTINEECVKQAVKTGLGIGAKINLKSIFDRKNYFYPDLPQGYQISQFLDPIVGEGAVEITLEDGSKKTIRVERIHLEQDAGKSIHDQHPTMSLIDLNRSGVALMEIVSKPDMTSPYEAAEYVKTIRSIVRALGTSDGDMEKGNLRCDANVSVRKVGEQKLGTRCEIKKSLPELPQARKERYIRDLGLTEYDAGVLTADEEISAYFEQLIQKHEPRLCVTWLTVELFGRMNKLGINFENLKVSAANLVGLLDLIKSGEISGKIAKDVLDLMMESGDSASSIVESKGLKQVSDSAAIEKIINEVISSNADQFAKYVAGDEKLHGFFVGQTLKASKGQANPSMVNELLRKIKESKK